MTSCWIIFHSQKQIENFKIPVVNPNLIYSQKGLNVQLQSYTVKKRLKKVLKFIIFHKKKFQRILFSHNLLLVLFSNKNNINIRIFGVWIIFQSFLFFRQQSLSKFYTSRNIINQSVKKKKKKNTSKQARAHTHTQL